MAITDSPYEAVATALKTVIDTEFAAEGITAIHDNIHESLGDERVTVGIAPTRDAPSDGNMVQLECWIEVKFYDLWDKKISPQQTVNPFKITKYAERLRKAVRGARATFPGTTNAWFFDVMGVEYPNDPTGNKTRFVVTLRSFSQNSGLVETS